MTHLPSPSPSLPALGPLPERLLLSGIVLYSAQDPEASAVLIENGTVAWTGPEDSAATLFEDVTRCDLPGCLVTPSFIDVIPTADGSDPAPGRLEQARALGVTAMAAGPAGEREGVLAVAPAARAGTRYLTLASQGTPLAFGSGGPEHADPWTWVRAAAHEGPEDERISDRAAFLAATRGGRRLLGIAHPGSLVPGAPAALVVWEPWDLTVRGQDERIQTWSTDPRSRTPMLPDLTEGSPHALLTVDEGRVVHRAHDQPGGAA